MRYETIVTISVYRASQDFDIGIDFYVLGEKRVDVERTQFRRRFGTCETRWWEADEWFWDICPESISKRLDREMLAAWGAEHGLTVRKGANG